MNVSLICACKNRRRPLEVALASWLLYEEIKEIIIVDWSSDYEQRLNDLVDLDDRIKIIRVDNEKYFNLTQPLNLAAKLATQDYILKVDCDYVLNPYNNFFSVYKIDGNSFVSGHHELANPEKIDERTGLPGVDLTNVNIFEIRDYVNSYSEFFKYLRGLLLVSRESFNLIGGYNEEFDTYYAYDDDNICARLELLGLKHIKLKFDYSWIHIPHSDIERLENFKGYHETGQKQQLESLENGEHKWNTAYYLAQSHINKNKELHSDIKSYYCRPKLHWRISETSVDGLYQAIKDTPEKLQGFPYVICLSLDESEQRRNHLKQEFDNYAIKHKFLVSPRFHDTSYQVIGEHSDSLNPGTKGCAISHIQAMEMFIDSLNSDYCLICEDDLSLETIEYWDFEWQEFMSSLPDDWDVIQLMIISDRFDTFKLKPRGGYEWGASAYLIKKSHARKIVEYCSALESFNVYKLEVPGNSYLQPLVENIVFASGTTYSVPLFVENTKFASTFVDKDSDVKDGQKNNHELSRETVLNYWKSKKKNPQEPKNKLEASILAYSQNVEDAQLNYNVGLEYEAQGHNAPALSYFLRAAERASDDLLAYKALIHGSNCYDRQGTRDSTAKAILQQAMMLLPERPEARFLLAKFSEKREWWQDCYIYASEALDTCDFDLDPIEEVDYLGKPGLLFLKGVASWWWGKTQKAISIMKQLDESPETPELLKQRIKENIEFMESKIK